MGRSAAERCTVVRHETVRGFEEVAGDFLLAREAEHNLLLGILSELRDGLWDVGTAYLGSVHDGQAIVGVGMRTPPHNLALSCFEREDALPALVEDVEATAPELPGVLGPTATSAAFARLWSQCSGSTTSPGMRMRVHRADAIAVPAGVPGRMRDATREDLDLLVPWTVAFERDALGEHIGPDRAQDLVERMLGSGSRGLVLWDVDGTPVSMAGFGGPTPNGIRVFAVYTPPQLRGRGYAGACVATLSRRLLDEGRRFCFLFTDVANPTSNAIYHRIGYRPVIDVDEYRLVTPAP